MAAPGAEEDGRRKKSKAKDRRAAEQAQTAAEKERGIHRGSMKEAHRAQRRGSTRELIDKEEGIKKAYPEHAARKTGQRIKQAIKRESGE